MALVVTGLMNTQSGGELGISGITVKAHRGRVMQKMKAGSLADLVNIAARLGIRASAGQCETDVSAMPDDPSECCWPVLGREV